MNVNQLVKFLNKVPGRTRVFIDSPELDLCMPVVSSRTVSKRGKISVILTPEDAGYEIEALEGEFDEEEE